MLKDNNTAPKFLLHHHFIRLMYEGSPEGLSFDFFLQILLSSNLWCTPWGKEDERFLQIERSSFSSTQNRLNSWQNN